MGLELVEFICRVEQEFSVEISDEIAHEINTPKNLTDYPDNLA